MNFDQSPNAYRVWRRSNGHFIWWKDMTDQHLEGAIRKLRRQADQIQRALDGNNFADYYKTAQQKKITDLRLTTLEMKVYLKSRKREQENFQAPKIEYVDYGREISLRSAQDWHWYTSREAQTTVGFSYFGNRTWRSSGGVIKLWKDMDATHIMNCVRLLERASTNNPTYSRLARDMHRYVAHREKAHA